MTCCGICKITKKQSIEESVCGCPEITVEKDGTALVSVNGFVFSLGDYLKIRSTANKDAKSTKTAKIIWVDKQ